MASRGMTVWRDAVGTIMWIGDSNGSRWASFGQVTAGAGAGQPSNGSAAGTCSSLCVNIADSVCSCGLHAGMLGGATESMVVFRAGFAV